MGLPAVRIAESMIPKLVDILESNDVNVEKNSNIPVDFSTDCIHDFSFTCSSHENVSILVYSAKAVGDSSGDVILILKPISMSPFKVLSTNRLLNQIQTVLRQNGATDVQG